MKTKQILIRISEYIEKITSLFCMILAFIMFFSVLIQVLNRYLLQTSAFYWTEEVSRYCMIYLAFLGANMLVRRNTMTSVRFIVDRINGKPRIFIEFLIKFLIFAFTFYVFIVSIRELPKFSIMEKSSALMMSMLIPKSSVFVGMFLVSVQMLLVIAVDLIDEKEKGGITNG